jgi:hypothetical protein
MVSLKNVKVPQISGSMDSLFWKIGQGAMSTNQLLRWIFELFLKTLSLGPLLRALLGHGIPKEWTEMANRAAITQRLGDYALIVVTRLRGTLRRRCNARSARSVRIVDYFN